MRDNSSSDGFIGQGTGLWLLAFLVISAAYLYAFPQANILYAAVVLLHAFTGVVTAILLVPTLFRFLRNGSLVSRAGWVLVAVSAVLGLILIKTGTSRAEFKWLYLHIAISLVGVGLAHRRQALASAHRCRRIGSGEDRHGAQFISMVLAGVAYGARHYIRERWQTRSRIENPQRCLPVT